MLPAGLRVSSDPPFLASVIFLCVTTCSLFLRIQEASSEECMVLSPKILQICRSTERRLLKYQSPCKQLWRQPYPRCVYGRWTRVCSCALLSLSPLCKGLSFSREEVHCGKQSFITHNKNPCKGHFWPNEVKCSFQIPLPFLPLLRLCPGTHTGR